MEHINGGYSVTFRAARGEGAPEINTDDVLNLFELLESASIATGRARPLDHYSVSFSVDAWNAIDAVHSAEKAWQTAHDACALPLWPVVGVTIQSDASLESELDAPNFPTLAGIAELAEVIGASRQRAHALARSERFPAPVAELRSGPVFLRASIDAFVEKWKRTPGRPRKDTLEAVVEEMGKGDALEAVVKEMKHGR